MKYSQKSEDERYFWLDYPVKFTSTTRSSVKVTGTIDFGIGMAFTRRMQDGRAIWNAKIAYKEKSEITDFNCQDSGNCEDIKNHLETAFRVQVIQFDSDIYFFN